METGASSGNYYVGVVCEKCGKYITQPSVWAGTALPPMCICLKQEDDMVTDYKTRPGEFKREYVGASEPLPEQVGSVKLTTGLTPHKCPICQGTGNVPGGFYTSVGGGTMTSDRTSEQCRACKGEGIIWG